MAQNDYVIPGGFPVAQTVEHWRLQRQGHGFVFQGTDKNVNVYLKRNISFFG